MNIKNIIIAVFIAIAWGVNFVSVKFAFQEMPPFLFLTLRFILTIVPAIFFLPKPSVSWKTLIWLSLFQWMMHFSLLFSGLYMGVPVGISSLLVQSQIIFTIIFACVHFKSRLSLNQIIGVCLSFIGLIMIALQDGFEANILGYVLIIGAAIAVGVSNILYRQLGQVNMLSTIVWSTLPALPPMILMTLFVEGWDSIYQSCLCITWVSLSSIVYTVVISTFLGYFFWANLMNKCDPTKVAPFALLVPVVAMTASYVMLDEILSREDIMACGIILLGLVINQIKRAQKSDIVQESPIDVKVSQVEDIKEAA